MISLKKWADIILGTAVIMILIFMVMNIPVMMKGILIGTVIGILLVTRLVYYVYLKTIEELERWKHGR